MNQHGLQSLADGDYGKAIEHFRAALDADPTFADCQTNLGVAQFILRHFADAAQSFQHSLAIRPDHAETLLNLGYTFWRMNQPEHAGTAFRQAIEISDLSAAHLALGSLYWETGNEELAIQHSKRGLEGEPNSLLGYDTLREISHYRGREDDALAACDAVIQQFPDEPRHIHKKALVMVTYGDPAGWRAWEACRPPTEDMMQLARQDEAWSERILERRWDGRQTSDLLVVVWGGYGDVIQFSRFLPLAAERCERLMVLVPASLRTLFSKSFHIANMTLVSEFPTEFDHYCTIISLPCLLDAVERIPSLPYLTAGMDLEVQSLQGLKVGLVWAGSPDTADDHWRSMPFSKLQPLLDLPAHFISLQFPCLEQVPLLTLRPPANWEETATVVNALNLVITVDTAVAHLAGALGKPVWLLNRYNTCWRWGLGSATPWYPTMRIFRQPKMGDWHSVIQVVRHELAAMCATT